MQRHTDVLARHVRLTDRDVVDVGCGEGGLVRWMRGAGARVIGVECGEALRTRAIEADPLHAATYHDGVAEALPLDDESMDVVVFSYSFHHVPIDAMPVAQTEARRVLRAGGRLYVLEPRPTGADVASHFRLVVDETHEQNAAQECLDGAESAGLAQVEFEEYESETSYADFDSWARMIVDIDPDRAARFAANRAEIERGFRDSAVVRDGRFVFTRSNVARVFVAV